MGLGFKNMNSLNMLVQNLKYSIYIYVCVYIYIYVHAVHLHIRQINILLYGKSDEQMKKLGEM